MQQTSRVVVVLIPGFPIESILAGLLVGFTVLLLARYRDRKIKR